MNKRALVTALVIAALALGVSLAVNRPATPVAQSTYRSEAHGYSLRYPASLDVREYASDVVAFGEEDGEAMDAVAEAAVYVVEGEEGESFADAVSRRMASLCAADGPRSSFSCVGADRVQPFASGSGLQGYAFYLRGELTDLETRTVTESGKGPYFAFPLASGATASKALVIYPPVALDAAAVDSALLRGMAESVALDAAYATSSEAASGLSDQSSALSEYVSAHIGELSDAKAVLGGTFYVTGIEAHGGAGTVSYEDGHNAYVADFTYSFDERGNASVDSFKVR